MKNLSLKLAIATVIAGSITSVASADISLYDYDEASSSYEDAYFTLDMNAGKNREDAQSSYNLDLGVDYDRVVSSPDRDLTLKLNTDGSIKRAGTEGANSTDSYNVDTSVTVDNYFTSGSKGGFWYGSARVQADDAFEDLQTKLSGGLGYGRVTNVTPMAKAIRLVDELRKRGSIASAPSKAAYNQIAKIISRENEYKSKHGARAKYYQQHWVGDIEKVLKTSGVTGSLDAAGILGARDVLLDERISTRKYGWKVRAGLAYVGTNFEGLKDNPGVELGGEYHKPLSNETQFSNVATLLTTFDDKASYSLDNNMSLTHELDDRLDWENSWSLNYNHSATDSDDVTTNTLTSQLIYELGNSLDLTLAAKVKNSDGNNTLSTGERADGTDHSVNFGVRYRLK